MGLYCRICGHERPNEQFSGKGHKIHVCKHCKAKPKSQCQAIEDKDDIFGFLKQSRISERNVARLEQMAKSDNPQVATSPQLSWKSPVLSTKPEDSSSLPRDIRNCLGKLRDTNLILTHDG
jgi:hypothetical protein